MDHDGAAVSRSAQPALADPAQQLTHRDADGRAVLEVAVEEVADMLGEGCGWFSTQCYHPGLGSDSMKFGGRWIGLFEHEAEDTLSAGQEFLGLPGDGGIVGQQAT